MKLWQADLDGSSIHLAVEGSCGGTTLGLQMARQAISDGGRVLGHRPKCLMLLVFLRFFSDISPTESSRFHAMNLVGNVDQSLDSLENGDCPTKCCFGCSR